MTERWDIYDCNRHLTGRTMERGQSMSPDEYRVVVQVWIHSSRGMWLISKRAPNKKSYPLKWEPTGGCVLAGEDSISAAVREVKEEIGVSLNPGRWGIICILSPESALLGKSGLFGRMGFSP